MLLRNRGLQIFRTPPERAESRGLSLMQQHAIVNRGVDVDAFGTARAGFDLGLEIFQTRARGGQGGVERVGGRHWWSRRHRGFLCSR